MEIDQIGEKVHYAATFPSSSQPKVAEMSPRERAKLVIVEIIRQAGGTLENKTNLFKAFYWAHLVYAANNPDYLTLYPIVRMPNGPGIDNAGKLLRDMVADDWLKVGSTMKGEFEAFTFELTDAAPAGELSDEAIAAIKAAVAKVKGNSAKQASDESHAFSTSWRMAKDGEQLNIYIDVLKEDDYHSTASKMRETAKMLDSVWQV